MALQMLSKGAEKWHIISGRHSIKSREEKQMKNFMLRVWKEEEGQDLTEYALLVVLVALGAILAMGKLASAISNTFSTAASNLTSAAT
jgi:pilus assembly protein Flp/PilA